MKNKVITGFGHEDRLSKNVDWYTPKWIFDELGLTFDLDPCQPESGIPWIPTKQFYSLKDDGLKQNWNGLVWLNPPYGNETKLWIEKMHNHRNGIALVFARTDCKWFHDYVAKADAILFLKGRIKFVDGLNKTSNNGAGAGSMLIAWGQESVKALEKMSDKGLFVRL